MTNQKMSRKIAVYCSTRNRYDEMAVAVFSLRHHNPDVDVVIFAEDADVGIDDVDVVVLDGRDPFTDGVNTRTFYTYMSMVRLSFTKYLTCDKVLYLDIDTIVTGSLDELFNMDMTDYYIAAAKEPYLSATTGSDYFNTGVALMNIAKLRDGTDDRMLDMIRKEPKRFPDQDVINEVCAGNILELDSKYNESFCTKATSEAIIHHYAGRVKWDSEPMYLRYKEMMK